MSLPSPLKTEEGYEGMFLTCLGCSGQKHALIPFHQLFPLFNLDFPISFYIVA
jgi:hypothetical protein